MRSRQEIETDNTRGFDNTPRHLWLILEVALDTRDLQKQTNDFVREIRQILLNANKKKGGKS